MRVIVIVAVGEEDDVVDRVGEGWHAERAGCFL